MQQILNKIAAEGPSQGLLEALVCGTNSDLRFGEEALAWSVRGLRNEVYVKSYTGGDIDTNARPADFQMSIRAPDYKRSRPFDPTALYQRANATSGMSEQETIGFIKAHDINDLKRDMKATIEKQVSILLADGDVEYVDDQDTTRNYPCYSGTSPIVHTQTKTIATTSGGSTTYDALGAIDELVVACQAKGFQPDCLILGSDAVNQLLADEKLVELMRKNEHKPGIIDLQPEIGGSHIGVVNTPHGAEIHIYSCNEVVGGSALVGAKKGIMLRSGCCTAAFGINAFATDAGNFDLVSEKVAYCLRRENIGLRLYMASREIVVPNAMEWQVSTIAE